MHERVYFNGSIAAGARIAAISSAALYGRGVFSTIAIHDGEPFLLDKHVRRLIANSGSFGIELSTKHEEELRGGLYDLIAENHIVRGRARVTIFDESESEIWGKPDRVNISLLIMTADARPVPAELRLTASPYTINSTSPLAGVKSCNYMEHQTAYGEARSRGFGEALRLNERGHATSGSMANVFWEKGGTLFTPSLSTGCLAGTTREFVLENMRCEEVEAGIDVLESAERIFLTSAGIGVKAAAEFKGRALDTSEHRMTELISF